MNTNGLSNVEVLESRRKYGNNEITNKKKKTFFKEFIETLGDPIIKILLIALVIKTVFLFKNYDWFETLGILIAVFLSSFISTISELGSEKAFNTLQEESLRIKAKVKRNNKVVLIDSKDIVVGDILLLSSGDRVLADGKLVSGEISVDESSLNGETKEIYKNINDKVYRGCVVYSGNCLIKVDSVGNNTFYGKMAKEINEDTIESPLKIRLRNLAKIISKIGYIGAFLATISYLLVSGFTILNLINAITIGVTIIVVAVPEGLPMMITLVLSSNMKRMLKDNVLVRKLVGIETAGSLNILFTDKTGTLTKGNLKAISFISGSLNNYNNELELSKYEKLYKYLKISLIYNNESILEDNKIINGNNTDRALRSFINTPIPKLKVIAKNPFSSEIKTSSCIVEYHNKEIEFIKGAPEYILDKCRFFLNEDGIRLPLNKSNIINYIDKFTSLGNRLILLAFKEKEYTLLGFMVLKDEIRKEAINGLELVKKANINTIMITGDNKNTAISVGKELGLITSSNDIVLTSLELNSKSDEEIAKLLPNLKIVARSMPLDKSRLVSIAQKEGLVVGMTGDGVNDAPALKKADIGFSMGSGTEVAKEASEIVILDDNFLSITKAILYGRTTFKSIRKFIIFQLTINICAILLSVLGPLLGISSPITIIQMLWINMIMDTLAGIAFSFEPALKEYMEELPKKREENILNKYMLGEILITGIYSSLLCILFLKLPFIKNLYRSNINNNYFMTAFFALFIFIGIFNAFNSRTHRLNLFAHLYKNIVFIIVFIFITIIQIFLLYYGGNLFRSYGLTLKELVITLLIAISVIPVDIIRKLFLKNKSLNTGV